MSACVETGSLSKGLEIYKSVPEGSIAAPNFHCEFTIVVCINLYANCGQLEEAQKKFEEFKTNNRLDIWNTMISILASMEKPEKHLISFRKCCNQICSLMGLHLLHFLMLVVIVD